LDALGALVTRDACFAVGDQIRLTDTLATPETHNTLDRLNPFGIRNSNHRDISHGRMTRQSLFHFPAVNILTAGNAHVFLPVDQIQITQLVKHTDVTGVIPTVANGFNGGVSVIPIGIEHRRRSDNHLARCPDRHSVTLIITQLEVDFGTDPAYGTE